MDKDFIIWLFNNFRKDENDLFYHKKDHQYVKDRYTFEKLKEIYFSKNEKYIVIPISEDNKLYQHTLNYDPSKK